MRTWAWVPAGLYVILSCVVSPCVLTYSPGAGWGQAIGVWICHSTPGQCEPSVGGLVSELWAQQGPGSREDQQRWLPGSWQEGRLC